MPRTPRARVNPRLVHQAYQTRLLAQQELERQPKLERAQLGAEKEAAGQQKPNQPQQLSSPNKNPETMYSPMQQSPTLDGPAWTSDNMPEEPMIEEPMIAKGKIAEKMIGEETTEGRGSSSPLFVPMSPSSASPARNAPVAPMQPSPHVTSRQFDTLGEESFPFSDSQSHTPTRNPPITAAPRTLELQMSETRKRKRDPAQGHPDIPSIIKTLERLEQQHKLDLADRDSKNLRLKLRLNDFQNADLDSDDHDEAKASVTMAQQSAFMKAEIASLKKAKLDAEWKIKDLCDRLDARDDDVTAFNDWTYERDELIQKTANMEEQLHAAQQQLRRFMEAFNRESALRKEINAKLQTQEKFSNKLSKDLKKKSEELKDELAGGARDRYAQLAAAVRGLFEHAQMDFMIIHDFGDVGRALKRVKDLVTETGEQANSGGNGRAMG